MALDSLLTCFVCNRSRTQSNPPKQKLNETMRRYPGIVQVPSDLQLIAIHTYIHTGTLMDLHSLKYTYIHTYTHSLKKRIVSDEDFVKQKQSQLKAKIDSIAQQKAQARAQVMANEVKAETLVKKAAEVRMRSDVLREYFNVC